MKTLKKIGKRLLNNWLLKLFSLAVAFLLWLVVMNIDDPEEQLTVYNIPVKLVNTDILADEDMVYEILDKTDVVRSVTITAPKSVKDELSSSDIVAEADFSNLTVTNTVEIRFYSLRYNDKITSISGSNEILKLNIEEKKTKRLVLEVQTTGEVAEGYIINDVTSNQNRIEVSGPSSVISQIAEAVVQVDVTDSTSDISTNADVKLYDADGKEIATDRLSMNMTTALVKVEILDTKTVPVVYTAIGTPAEGYLFTGEITGTPERILIAGTTEALQNVNRIVVPEDVLNITGQTGNLLQSVNIAEYLPEGTILADNTFNGKILVTVHIEEEYEKTLNISASHIQIIGVPEGYTAKLSGETIVYTLRVKGLQADVNAIDTGTLYGTIDVADIVKAKGWNEPVPGIYETEVEFILPADITIEGTLEAYIEITELEEIQ
ncbi:MAG: YbbR-like domain-containing protein [Lachnospiraceae bacterium]